MVTLHLREKLPASLYYLHVHTCREYLERCSTYDVRVFTRILYFVHTASLVTYWHLLVSFVSNIVLVDSGYSKEMLPLVFLILAFFSNRN